MVNKDRFFFFGFGRKKRVALVDFFFFVFGRLSFGFGKKEKILVEKKLILVDFLGGGV